MTWRTRGLVALVTTRLGMARWRYHGQIGATLKIASLFLRCVLMVTQLCQITLLLILQMQNNCIIEVGGVSIAYSTASFHLLSFSFSPPLPLPVFISVSHSQTSALALPRLYHAAQRFSPYLPCCCSGCGGCRW